MWKSLKTKLKKTMAEEQHSAPETPQPGYDLPTSTAIRLLKIVHVVVPKDGSERSVFFEIRAFELATAPSYLALSYTWPDPMRADIFSTDDSAPPGSSATVTSVVAPAPGTAAAGGASSDDDDTPAFIGERRYRATKNLRDGLAHIYLAGLGSEWVWADAVCIDQESEEEKAVQVGMMDEIYSRAGAVVVWLGADESNLDEFLWIHGEFFDALLRFMEEHGAEGLLGQAALDPSFTRKLGVTPPGGSCPGVWQKYFAFCRQRRWFSRAWIVQEVTLAKRIIVLCGSKSVSWARMVAMAEMIVLLGWQSQVGVEVDTGFGRAVGDEVVRLLVARRVMEGAMASGASEKVTNDADVDSPRRHEEDAVLSQAEQRQRWFTHFMDLLLNMRVYSATDPRDKALYTSITSMFLHEVPNLGILSLVEDRASRKMKDQPTWVPDFTCHLTGMPLTTIRADKHAFDCDPEHSASQVACHISGNRLFVHGAEFDRIEAVATPMWDVVRMQIVHPCLTLCEGLSPEYQETHTGPGEVLWSTMTTDTFDQKPAPDSIAASFRSWVTMRLAMHIANQALRHDDTTGQLTLVGLQEVIDDDAVRRSLDILSRLRAKDNADVREVQRSIPSPEDVIETAREMYKIQLHHILALQRGVILDPEVEPFDIEEATLRLESGGAAFKQAIAPVLPFRQLYRTSRGYLGLGPASAEPGDLVYLLRGAKVPFVLRTSTDTEGAFELMGETYLHGFMDGEMARPVGDDVSEIVLV